MGLSLCPETISVYPSQFSSYSVSSEDDRLLVYDVLSGAMVDSGRPYSRQFGTSPSVNLFEYHYQK